MDDQNGWNAIQALFLEVRDLSAEERRRAIDEACGPDDVMRAEVESLLQHHDQATLDPGWNPQPPPSPTVISDREPESLVGSDIGHYRILHKLGEGGMGMVLLAVRKDDKFRKTVALKVIKRGMDSEQILRRFALERQMLAALTHPNIARLLDGGATDDGRPYFALEYVEGEPLDVYCDSHRLNISQRLEFFRSVCAAVQYAHQNLIVHRDIKPSNIIVTPGGTPKLLDFGIAKILNPEMSALTLEFTTAEMRLMTPEYASPEQVRRAPITTASDIYSLGVLLYELLSGHRPYHLRTRLPNEIQRIICDEDPERPSTAVVRTEEIPTGLDDPETPGTGTRTITPESVSRTRGGKPERLRRRLKGDIDNIILMAMRKEPQRRYASVEQLSLDIAKHLDGLPVLARPLSAPYRLSKFVRRNRAGVSIAALIVVAVGVGIYALFERQAAATASAREELLTAQAEADQARVGLVARSLAEMSESLLEFHDSVKFLTGATEVRQLITSRIVETADQLNAIDEESLDDRTILRMIADAYDRLGQVQSGVRSSGLGDDTSARRSFEHALDIRLSLAAAQPEDPDLQREIGLTHLHLGDLFEGSPRAAAHYGRAAEVLEKLVVTGPASFDDRMDFATVLLELGDVAFHDGRSADADKLYDRSIAIREEIVAERGDPFDVRNLDVAHQRRGRVLRKAGLYAEAMARFQDSLEVRKTLRESAPSNASYRRDVVMAHFAIAHCASFMDDEARRMGLDHLDAGIADLETLIADDPVDNRYRRDRAYMVELQGIMLESLGEVQQALERFTSYHALTLELVERAPSSSRYRDMLVTSAERIWGMREHLDLPESARAQISGSITRLEGLARSHPTISELPETAEHIRAILAKSGG